jgi:transposase
MRSEFDAEATQLDLSLGFDRGARFGCPVKGCAHGGCPVHDTVEETWRHLDFFQHRALLHARLPRVRCPSHGVRQVEVPWARPGSGFTVLFEALVLRFAAVMPMAKVAAMTAEHDTRIWRVVEHHAPRRPRPARLHRRAAGRDGGDLRAHGPGAPSASSPTSTPAGWSSPPRDAAPGPSDASPLTWPTTAVTR